MRNQFTNRLISMLLVFALLVGFVVLPPRADAAEGVTFSVTDNSAVSNPLRPQQVEEKNQTAIYAEDEMVRVSIILWRTPTLQAGFSTQNISNNSEAMAYRAQLKKDQTYVTAFIEKALGQELEVVWNLTLAANLISANVEYGQIATIEKIPGVQQVVLETRYRPMEAVTSAEGKPNMIVSANMTGATQVWDTGYTGGGTRIAVIDTGLDTDHQSFDPDAFAYALMENAAMEGLTYEEYLAKLDLLDVAELEEKLTQLNVYKRDPEMTAEKLYANLKAPFGYNYLDEDLDITHDNDSQGSHGSHVSGISAANRYIKQGDEYVSAADSVSMLGNAPDAQIIVMKVFGKLGGCYESDYFAAIEDAIILDCDAINLSLGSDRAGFTVPNSEYQELMKYLVETESVVAMAAGNQGCWAAYSSGVLPNLYIEDTNFQTAGTPGTYPNAFTVASVQNDGSVGPSIRVAGVNIGYMDGDGYWNEPMTSMDPSGTGTVYEYVFIDGIGQESDYAGIDVTGKMVFVSRGEINFADKANIAYQRGAVATIVYNNVAEGISMNLTGYQESAPCVIISMQKGQQVKEKSQAVTTDAGVTYYTGKLTVCSANSPNQDNADYYTMSSFSSWGVPGDLTLKPEITAPGGNIYSINGAVPETDQYELMSGTSMATPQVSGFVALMKQAIRERGLSQIDLTDRALVQSILMSTALPLKDGEGRYYPVMQQGAGMVDILAAVMADSFILVNGQEDGKVKVELGDDPSRTGVYTFTFTINNLDDAEKIFVLSADMFTQDAFAYYANTAAAEAGNANNLALYLDTATAAMDFTADWSSDGQMLNADYSVTGCDFDGDLDVDQDDAQVLLDFVTGARAAIENAASADVSGDGLVDTYDVHVLLTKLQGNAVKVPANESVQVTVTLTLTEEQKEYLDTYYVNGAYVQAYVYADAIADAEGVDGTCHSIPVLGFYGSWTDASMFEVGTVQSHACGDETRDPYTGTTAVNSLSVEYARDPGYTYFLGGNPVVADSTYRPERNAFNNQNGDKIDELQINTLRNAYASRMTAVNLATGEILKQYESGKIYAPYYGVVFFMEMWLEGLYSYNLQWSPRNVAEGDTIEFLVEAAPEYYVDENGNVDWDALGDGARFTIPLTMDSTAPAILDINVDVENNVLTVQASDNQYVAAVALFNGSGKEVLTYVGSKDEAVPGETYTYELDLSVANGNKFLIQVYDYAYNVTTYELRMELGVVPPLPDMIAFDKEYNYYWTAFDLDAWYRDLSIYCETEGVVFNAATIYDHYVFACDEKGDLYVMPEGDLSDMTRIRNLGVVFQDMAYNPVDGEIYGVAYNEYNESVLYTVDKYVGTVTQVGTVGMNINTLACDNDGTFYCNEFGTCKVYSFTLETMDAPTYMLQVVNDERKTFATMGTQAMEFNPNTGKVVWTSYYYEEKAWGNWDFSYLYEINPKNNTYTLHNDLSHQLVALVIPQEGKSGDWAAPTDDVLMLELSHETLNLLRGNTERLTVTILPWNLTDNSVTWTVEDPSIVDVNQYGLVTALNTGTTTITVTSNLDPSFSDTVTVTVEALPIYMEGVLLDADGNPMEFLWDMAGQDNWTPGMALDAPLLGATKTPSGDIIGLDTTARTLVHVDMTTGVSTALGTWETQMYDLAYSNLFSDGSTERVHMISGSFWIPAKDPSNPYDDQAWDLFDYLYDESYAFEFVAIATGGVYTVEDGGKTHRAEELFFLDDNGHVWKLYAYADGDFYNATEPVCYTSNLEAAGYSLHRLEESLLPLCSMVVGEDGNLYFSGYNGKTNVFYQLVLDEETQTCNAIAFANAGEDVWPAIVTGVSGNVAGGEEETYVVEAKLSQTAQRVDLSEANTREVLPLENAEEVTITVTADMDVTNGLLTVEYDERYLTLQSVNGTALLTSAHQEAGKLTFGYAGEDYLLAGETLVTLVFTRSYGTTTDVVITTTQRNEEHLQLQETVTVELLACDHANTEVRDAKEASCTEAGYTGDTYCTDCGALVAAGEAVAVKGHSHAVTDSKEASCTEEGYVTYTCHCGDTYTEVVEAAGHTYVITDTEGTTCTEDGSVTYTCHCGDTYTEVIPAHGHSYEDGVCQHCGETDAGNPPTGGCNLYAMVLAAMMSVVAVVCVAGKKERQ